MKIDIDRNDERKLCEAYHCLDTLLNGKNKLSRSALYKENKKLYQIIKAKCIVSRKCGIKEMETFSFLANTEFIFDINILLSKQIDFYNEFCPEDYVITKFENESFETVGEICL